MRKAPIIGLAGLVGAGLLAAPVGHATTTAGDEQAYLKRDDQVSDLVLVADDDDDDTNDTNTGTNTGNTNTGTGTRSGDQNDATNSRVTRVSRDRDLSRSDKTRDWTRDGGSWTRDRSANLTNDRSRNDTRR
ncbi:MAG TPA: hypothetical protein VFK41_04850 [Nocardioidaceae bacterium]|nr:hypothetical protein [Nocardioidaceae bacterium]